MSIEVSGKNEEGQQLYMITNRISMLHWSKKHGWTPNYADRFSKEDAEALLDEPKISHESNFLDPCSSGVVIG